MIFHLPRFQSRSALGFLRLAAGLVALCGASGALAEGPETAAKRRCSGLGTDFVAVSGAGGCVRIGGHVRAETMRAHAAPSAFAPQFSSAADGIRPASESFHVRGDAPIGGTEIYRR